MKRFDLITLFPEACAPYAQSSILGRAQKKKLITIAAHQLRKYSKDKKHGRVDSTPYGGGPGMVMQIEPFDLALKKLKRTKKRTGYTCRVILTSASGKQFTQADAKRLAKYDQLIFLCGRYEGIDARVEEHLADEALSIGEYVLTGGELPALVMIDAVARMIPGVLGKAESLEQESHAEKGLLEYPQYTKPEVYKKWRVPKLLLSGDHAKISGWRKQQQRTRP